ncbi:hypothetical protein Tco_0768129 [Tanacetum coccineum]
MEDGIFFNQSKYIKEMLKKFGLEDSKPTKTPISMEIKLAKDDEAVSVDITKYRGMIGSLLYLTASRPDIMFSVCLCARFQENPKTTHLEAVKHIFRALESRYANEGRTIDTSFYRDISDEYVAKFNNIGICLYSNAWVLDELEKTLEQDKPYNSTLPVLDDIQNLVHRRTVHAKVDKEGKTIHKLPNQIETNELLNYLRPCKLVISENVYSDIGNRDHTQAIIALMLYCVEIGQRFNLAYFIIRRMYYFRDRKDKILPYGMILTLLFKTLKANMVEHPFDECYILVPRKMSSLKAKQPKKPPPKITRNVGKSKRAQLTNSSSSDSPPLDSGDFPSTKLSPRSYGRALPVHKDMSDDQRETRGMFKNLARALHKFAKMLKKGCH